MRSLAAAVVGFGLLGASQAQADVTLLTQTRSISARSTFNGATTTSTAPTFGTFIDTVSTTTPFPLAGGGVGNVVAVSSINCVVDPNRVRTNGLLSAAGGLALLAGTPTEVLGEAKSTVNVTFNVLTPTAFSLSGLPNPSSNPGDVFEFSFKGLHGGVDYLELSETDAAQSVNISGILLPGEYSIRYHVEIAMSSSVLDQPYGFDLRIPTPGAGSALVIMGLLSTRRRRR